MGGEIGRGIVRGSTALATDRSKLGLEKQSVSLDPFLRYRLQRFTHQGFLVMDQLVGRVDGPEA